LSIKKVVLKPGKDKSARRRHPWVFSGAIDTIIDAKDGVQEGEVVEVLSSDKETLGFGFWADASIAVKIFTFEKTAPTKDLWKTKIRDAITLRQKIGLTLDPKTTMYRVVNAEGDGLPGVIVDRYDNALVIQYQNTGAQLIADDIETALKEHFGQEISIIYRKASKNDTQAADPATLYRLGEKSDQPIALENGYKFIIDWERGQKTGFFLDQRSNRELVKRFSKDRTVLNAFSYSGGFSVYALAGGALSVDSVDASKDALKLCEENIGLNCEKNNIQKFTNHESTTSPITPVHNVICDDCLTYLRNIDQKYDLIILDPPAFAKHRDAIRGAVDGYRDINRLAIKSIKPDGIIFTFSCSQLITKEQFQETVFSAASQAGRDVQIIYRLGQSEDHPFSIFHLEGEYLKGLVLRVT